MAYCPLTKRRTADITKSWVYSEHMRLFRFGEFSHLIIIIIIDCAKVAHRTVGMTHAQQSCSRNVHKETCASFLHQKFDASFFCIKSFHNEHDSQWI